MVKGFYNGRDESYRIEGSSVRKIVPYRNEEVNVDGISFAESNKVNLESRPQAEIQIPSFMNRRTTSHQRWHYVDMKEHDAEVIRREHMRQREYRRQRQMQRERERKEALRNILYFAKQKLIGLAFVAVSLWLIFSGIMYDPMVGENDCTFALITIPIGLILMFSKNRWFFDYQEDDDVWE